MLQQKLFLHFLNQGIYISNKNSGNLSAVIGRAEMERFVEVWEAFLVKVKSAAAS
jgi:hypothetical protein